MPQKYRGKCCVPKCNSLRQDVTFHKFPSAEENKKKWIKCIFSDIDIDDRQLHFVCHKHFEKRFVRAGTGQRLTTNGYPSLFTDLEICTGIPAKVSSEIETAQAISLDHNYTRKQHIDHSYMKSIEPEQGPSKGLCREVIETADAMSLDHNMTRKRNIDNLYATSIEPEQGPSKVPCVEVMVTLPSVADQVVPVESKLTSIQNATGSVCKTPRRKKKNKLIHNVMSLTPRCRLFYREYKKTKRQNNYKERAKRALAFSKEKSFEDLSKNMNPLLRKVLLMQVKLCTKKKMARRYTTEEKLIALSIYKQGPKSYTFLQKIFILPSKTTLKKMISQLDKPTK